LSDTPATTEPVKRRPRWRRWLLEALVFLAAFSAFQLWQARDTPHGAAPNLAGQLIDGQPFDLATWHDQNPGRAQLLYFWAEWCPICKTTAGNVSNISADWPVTSIATQSGPPTEIAKVVQDKDYRWSTLADPQGKFLSQYGLHGVPALVIINPAGEISFVSVGFTSEIGLRLRLWWASWENS
jgi:thiol-disulfide isomerase/thioredoxin